MQSYLYLNMKSLFQNNPQISNAVSQILAGP